MKKQIKKVVIVALIWAMIMVSVIISKTYAEDEGLSILSIKTNKSSYSVGEEVEVKIKLNEKVMSASYYLNYNSSALKYKEAKTTNLAVKDYPNEKLIKSVYFDINGTGVDEITVVFTLEAATNDKISFSLTNTTMTTAQDSKSYANEQITGIQKNAEIQVKAPESEKNNTIGDNTVENTTNTTGNNTVENTTNTTGNNTVENKTNTAGNNTAKENNGNNSGTSTQTTKRVADKTTSRNVLPKTGSEDIYKYLIIALVIVTIYLGYNVIKLGKYF